MVCSLTGTIAAAFLLIMLVGDGTPSSRLRLMGAGGGAAVAIAIVALSLSRRNTGVQWQNDGGMSVAPRFVFERRHALRRTVRTPVQVSVNGRTCEAVLLSVSATGALLRLRGAASRALEAQVGHLVQIDEHPVGRLARMGAHGMYVEFAVMFDPGAEAAPKRDALSLTSSG